MRLVFCAFTFWCCGVYAVGDTALVSSDELHAKRLHDQVSLPQEMIGCLMRPSFCPSANINITAPALDEDRRVAEKLFSKGDNFSALVAAYEDNVNGSSDDVKQLIGRGTEDWIVNTCVIRVSYAMNQSAVPEMRITKRAGLSLISDRADPTRGPYAYRV